LNNPGENKIEFVLKNNLMELNKLSTILDEYFTRFGLDKLDLHDINLVLEEWFTNLIHHGFDDGQDSKVRIVVEVTEKEFFITFSDEGKYFNPRNFSLPDLKKPLEQRAVGGIGLHLIFRLMDSIKYSKQNGVNVLQLKKYRTK